MNGWWIVYELWRDKLWKVRLIKKRIHVTTYAHALCCLVKGIVWHVKCNHRETLFHADAFYTRTHTFTHKRFYTQTLLHTEAFPHRRFTHRSFYTDAFTHRPFYTQALLHTKTFTHRPFSTHNPMQSICSLRYKICSVPWCRGWPQLQTKVRKHSCNGNAKKMQKCTNKGSVPWYPKESKTPCKNALNDSTITSSISWWHGWHLFHCISPMSLQDRTIFTAFTHRCFYTQKLLYIQTLLHLLHTRAFTQRRFYTQTLYTKTLSHTDAFTHRPFYTQELFRTDPFTHKSFYTKTLLHTDAFTHRRFYAQTLLHTKAFTHKSFFTQRPTSILCERLAMDTSNIQRPFRAKGLQSDTFFRNFSAVFDVQRPFRAKGLRGDTLNRNFSSVFDVQRPFRAKGSRWTK